MQRIKALYVVIEFVLTVSIIIVLMYIFNRYHRQIRRFWAKMQSKLIGYKIVVKGEIDPKAQMLIMNHQSLLDIVVLEDIYPGDIAWVAKKEIEKIPFFGHILKAPKMISIEREDRKSLIKLLKIARKRIEEGRVIGIFPEGTRSDGKHIKRFKSGAKVIAQKLDLRVQPVVIVNTREILDSQHLKASSGTVVVRFLDAVEPIADEEWYQEIEKRMREALSEELEALKAT